MNNRMKLYTRLDAQNNKIPGSSVKRLKMPRTGKWVEETVNICCFPYTELTYEPSDFSDDDFTLTILCDAAEKLSVSVIADAATTDVEELASLLNVQLEYLGDFSVSGADIVLKLKTEVSDSWACSGTLSFTVEPTA